MRLRKIMSQFFPTRVTLESAQCLGPLALIAAMVIPSPTVRGATLGEALNATYLTWTTSGQYGGWYSETTTTHDGVSAATSVVFGK
jgi:hypothetical protein